MWQILEHKQLDRRFKSLPAEILTKPIQTPEDSEVISITGSQVVLRVLNNAEPLYAGFDAIVSEVLPNQGAIIETDGVLVQGVWGNQQIGSGVLVNVMERWFFLRATAISFPLKLWTMLFFAHKTLNITLNI